MKLFAPRYRAAYMDINSRTRVLDRWAIEKKSFMSFKWKECGEYYFNLRDANNRVKALENRF